MTADRLAHSAFLSRFLADWPLDLRSLAVFRVGLGLLVLADLAARSLPGVFIPLHTDLGALPRSTLTWAFPEAGRLSIFMLSGTPSGTALLFLLNAACAVGLLVGWRTRAMSWACWVFALGLQGRNPMVINGGDIYLKLLLLMGCFLPLGRRASLDSRCETVVKDNSNAVASVAALWLLLQLVTIYFSSVWHKWSDHSWRYGLAVHYALSNELFATPLGHWVSGFPFLTRAANWATLMVEGCGALLALLPPGRRPCLRTLSVMLIWGLHASIMATMSIPLFCMTGVVGWSSLLPSAFWDRLVPSSRSAVSEVLVKRARFADALALLGLVSCLYFAFFSLPQVRTLAPLARLRPAQWLGIEQSWNMFSSPMTGDGWFVVKGRTTSGRTLNLLDETSPATDAAPASRIASMRGDRWRKLFTNLLSAKSSWLRKSVAESFCRGRDLARVEIVFMEEALWETAAKTAAKRRLLISHPCGGEYGAMNFSFNFKHTASLPTTVPYTNRVSGSSPSISSASLSAPVPRSKVSAAP